MAETGIIVVVIGLIAIALIIPILLDESPTAYIENGLCTIFAGGGNTTCGSILGNVTFIGDFPISITPDFANNTMTWSLGDIGNASHVNIGGGAEVFKNETAGLSSWRTLIGGGGVSVNELDQVIEIRTGGGGGNPFQNINNGSGNQLFSSVTDGSTVTFVGKGIKISNSSSVSFELNATADELLDVDYPTPPDEDQVLIFNATTGNFENLNIHDLVGLTDQYFNAEEATVDDLTEVDCVNDVTIDYFSIDPDEYRRQVIEYCSDGDIDDNITWFYVVPKEYSTATDYNFRLLWTDDDTSSSSYMSLPDQSGGGGGLGDCEEDTTDGDVNCGGSDLELHDASPTESDGIVGLRYLGLNIPNAATILTADIQFHVDEVSSGTLEVTFHGEDEDSSSVFLPLTDFDLSSRTKTTASVNWVVPSWPIISEEGAAQLTPDLSSIIQEIVDRPLWVSGNDLSLFIDAWPDNTGTRTAESLNGEPTNAPIITITWTTGGGGSPVCFEYSLMAIQNTELVTQPFIARDTQCVGRSGGDRLSVTEFTVLASDHNFSPEDLVWHRIVRPNDFVPDDFESDVFVFGGELQWLN